MSAMQPLKLPNTSLVDSPILSSPGGLAATPDTFGRASLLCQPLLPQLLDKRRKRV